MTCNHGLRINNLEYPLYSCLDGYRYDMTSARLGHGKTASLMKKLREATDYCRISLLMNSSHVTAERIAIAGVQGICYNVWGDIQTIVGKINVIVTLTTDPPPP